MYVQDCGMTHIRDEDIRKGLKERAPKKAEDIDGMRFGEFTEYVLPFLHFQVVETDNFPSLFEAGRRRRYEDLESFALFEEGLERAGVHL